MNATLCMTTDVELDAYDTDMAQRAVDANATEPMMAIRPLFQRPDEEVLHTLFEQAISERLTTSYSYWSRLHTNSLQPYSGPLGRTTDPIQPVATRATTRRRALVLRTWQRSLMYICLALMCMLSGFDFMGLLLLHLH
ncbi:MAG TPA: hypothetical protein VKX46_01365 [Ktedonobacteraceae bacterium]|nr:hypothetical protein [Ktedonobacteraceae bacterium]